MASGFPIPLDHDEKTQSIELLSLLCPHPDACYLVRASGDGLKDLGICSGDILIMDKSERNPSPQEIAVCELGSEFLLRRVVRRKGKVYLCGAAEDLPLKPSDAFTVWGTVTYVIHKPR